MKKRVNVKLRMKRISLTIGYFLHPFFLSLPDAHPKKRITPGSLRIIRNFSQAQKGALIWCISRKGLILKNTTR